jgi:hypothetical protein
MFRPANLPISSFQERAAELDTAADTVIALAGQHAKGQPAASLDVIGYIDTVGSAPVGVLLSHQRAHAVVANGVVAKRVDPLGLGPTGRIRGWPAAASNCYRWRLIGPPHRLKDTDVDTCPADG